ncbi:DHHC palmitoyltransferase-domain-containing protein [Phyllosticta citrichinensis]|uniref:Palmitoyltransferase n=1 Tax=Phyllosticta citrichinensis TaxID=1130410 RepID=A0ABR1XHB5_9PEZI
MATFASPSPPSSPSYAMPRRNWARKCERCCCRIYTYFPLSVVYGLTTWAAWVCWQIGAHAPNTPSHYYVTALLAWFLYALLNWSYTMAVFTDPGSPIDGVKGGYSSLPTTEQSIPHTSFTVKANGELRYCKKCQTKKPDRAHHCSTCGRCVLKMDHHCPWLATCVGLRNYKPFLLFLVYLSLFCWACFANSGGWCWNQFTNDDYMDSFLPINYIILAVIAGIVGLVMTGFTAWHVHLAACNLTTIESLEKTRYLSPLRRSFQHFTASSQRNYVNDPQSRPSIGDQLLKIHANALPGVTRPEEGEDQRAVSPAQQSLHRNWVSLEAARERDRYNEYLDELDSEKLPNAFDLGWRRNLTHVLGPVPYLWALPICNTIGDGWYWEASPGWIAARKRIADERFAAMQRQKARERAAGWGVESPPGSPGQPPSPPVITRTHLTANRIAPAAADPITNRSSSSASPPHPSSAWHNRPLAVAGRNTRFLTTSSGIAAVPREGRRSPNKADQILGRAPGLYSDDDPSSAAAAANGGGAAVQMQEMRRRRYDDLYDDLDDDDDDEEEEEEGHGARRSELAAAKAKEERPAAAAAPANGGTTASSQAQTHNWNDIPVDMVAGSNKPKTWRGARARRREADDEWDDWGPSAP